MILRRRRLFIGAVAIVYQWIAAMPTASIPLRIFCARKCAAALAAGRSLSSRPPPVTAHAQSVPIVRDAEIEALVRDYARPILQAAGLSKSGIEHHPGQ